MNPQDMVEQLARFNDFFNRSTSTLTEDDATFAPADGMYTSAQLVAHVAQTVDWFMEGAFRPEGFDLNFERAAAQVVDFTSMKDARAWVDRAFANAREVIGSKTMEELGAPLPDGPVMGGAPRLAIISGIEEHTAHHRGALSVYARLRGHQPPMPYGDM